MAIILEVKAGPFAGKRVAVMGGQSAPSQPIPQAQTPAAVPFAVLAPAPGQSSKDPDTVRIGMTQSIFVDIPPILVQMFAPSFGELTRECSGLGGQMVVGGDAFELSKKLRAHEVDFAVYQGVEFASGDAHPVVCLAHGAARVLDWSAGRLGDLLDEHRLEPRHVGPPELCVDATVCRCPRDEVADDRDDGFPASKPVVQGSVLHDTLPS